MISFAYVAAPKLVEYAEIELEVYTESDLLDCMANRGQILDVIKNPEKMFKGPGGQNLAAGFIQKRWKGFKANSNFRQLKYLMKMATTIQRRFRLYLLKSKTSHRLKEMKLTRNRHWNEMQRNFRQDWPNIKESRRIEIHINSFSIQEI